MTVKYRRVVLLLFDVFALPNYIQKPRYESHNIRNDAILIVFDNQTFLIGEEFTFAKQVKDSVGRIIYLSNLMVTHDEHSSRLNYEHKRNGCK